MTDGRRGPPPRPPPPPPPRQAGAAVEATDRALAQRLLATRRIDPATLAAVVAEQRARGGPGRVRLVELLVARGELSAREAHAIAIAAPSPPTAPAASELGDDATATVVGSPPISNADAAPGSPASDASGSARFLRHSPWPSSPASSSGMNPAASSSSGRLPAAVVEAADDPARRIGNYVLIAELGRGGMGVVHRAYDLGLRRDVAIKMVLDPRSAESPTRLKRFQQEAEAVARLRHPGIVAVHEIGVHEGHPFLVMDLVEGRSLEDVLGDGSLPPRRIAELIRETALALSHAHEHGILHRDVKPENVLVDADGRARLTDFGLARLETASERLTLTGELLGTPSYMAPEQADGKHGDQGPHTDVWALGGLLYRALTGRTPFEADSIYGIIKKVISEDPEPPRRRHPDVHPDLETIALRCLEKEPARRYASAAEVADELRRFGGGEAIRARPAGRRERAARWVRRNRALTAALSLVGGIALSGIGVAAHAIRAELRERAERVRAVEWARARAIETERQEAIAAARTEGRAALNAFLEQDGVTPRPAASFDELLARGLVALEATTRRAALDSESAHAREVAFRTATALGRAALAEEQWSVATSAFERAAGLGVDDAAARAAAAGVADARARASQARRDRIAAILRSARETDVLESAEGYEEHLFTLIGRGGGDEAAELVAAALEEVTAELHTAFDRLYTDAATPAERDAVVIALEALATLRPDERLTDDDAHRLATVTARLEERAADETGRGPSVRQLASRAQAEALGPRGLLFARFCAEALGLLGSRTFAVAALDGLLRAEQDELRAAPAARALCRIGGVEAISAVMRARERFPAAGPLETRIDRYLDDVDDDLPVDEESATAYRRRGVLRMLCGDLDGALADLDRAVQLAPDDSDTLVQRSRVHLRRNEPDPAAADATAALERDPKLALALVKRGEARRLQGDLTAALDDLTAATELQPSLADAWWVGGLIHRDGGSLDAAEICFGKAILEEPRLAGLYYVRGCVRMFLGRSAEAVEDFGRAVALDPLQGWAWARHGMALVNQGHPAEAIERLERAVEIEPDEAEIWATLGTAYHMNGQPRAAKVCFDEAIGLDPNEALAWANLGQTLQALGRDRDAVAALERAVEILPTIPLFWSSLGQAYSTIGNHHRAILATTRATLLDPGVLQAWLNRSVARMALGDLEGALADATTAVELDPKSGLALSNRAMMRQQLGDHEGAISDFGQLIELDGAVRTLAFNGRGVSLNGLGRHAEAIADFDRAIELSPNVALAWHNRAAAKGSAGNLIGAIDDAGRSIELDPGNSMFWWLRGRLHRDRKEMARAVSDFGRAAELAPEWADAWRSLGRARQATGDADGARAAFDRAVKLEPDHRALRNRAELRLKGGDTAGAHEDAARATELAPDDVLSWAVLAHAEDRLGRPDAAIAAWTRCTELAPGSSAAFKNRGKIRRAQGDLEGAIADLDRAIALDPTDLFGWTERGFTHSDARRFREAKADFEEFLRRAPDHELAAKVTTMTENLERLARHQDQVEEERRLEEEKRRLEEEKRRLEEGSGGANRGGS